MKLLQDEKGKVGWILLWALGVPIPILVILFLVRGSLLMSPNLKSLKEG